MEKHRLEIPEAVPKDLIKLAYQLSSQDGKEIIVDSKRESDDGIWVTRDIDSMQYVVPESWLTEIKEEPKTFDELVDSLFEEYFNLPKTDNEKLIDLTRSEFEDIIKRAIENERLKHKPKITLKESIKSRLKNIDSEATEIDIFDSLFYREGWLACLESHNLNE